MKSRRRWQDKFIQALRITANVWRACQHAKISRATPYAAYDADPEFAKQWKEAEEESADRIDAEIWRRAVEGIDKNVYHQGIHVDTIREYDTPLLMMLAKARRPEKYRENYAVAIGNPDGSNLVLDGRQQAINLFTSSPEAAQHMIALANMMTPEESMAKTVPIYNEDGSVGGIIVDKGAPSQETPPLKPKPAKAKKPRKAKQAAPEAQELEIDDSDAQPMGSSGLLDAFLPKGIDKTESAE